MPYEGEYASYGPLYRIMESETVKDLLRRSRQLQSDPAHPLKAHPKPVPPATTELPEYIVAIDGSNPEVQVRNGYPGARVGYCTVASVLLNMKLIEELDKSRPIDPVEFRKTETVSTIDAALPGSNIVTHDNISARDSFRETLYEVLSKETLDEEEESTLLRAYEELLKLKPTSRLPTCPYDYVDCDIHFMIPPGWTKCPCPKRRNIYSTDALRIHERFHEEGSNGEALGEVMQVWERVVLMHLIRCFERRGWLVSLRRAGFIIDGPLAFFGHPAWLSAAVSAELKRVNAELLRATGQNLILFGIEKTGTFVDHFAEIDQTEVPGELLFAPRSCFLPSDRYIKQRIIYSTGDKRYGADTYFGRKMFYKTSNGAKLIVNIPFLSDEQDTLESVGLDDLGSSDISLYPQIPIICDLLDKLVSSRFENAVAPIINANAAAAVPLNLGAKVLQQLAHALMRED
jgi:NurA domain